MHEELQWFVERYDVTVPVLGAFLTLFSLCTFLFTAFSDPGIVPRQVGW
jgi:hypothetical protein